MADAWLFAWGNFVKLFFLFCPFFVLNMFLSLTEGADSIRKRDIARRVTMTILVIGAILYFAGNGLLQLFGLELEGFRIGSGILLMIMAAHLALDSETPTATSKPRNVADIVVVPLAIPTIMGPTCVSAMIIIGAESIKDPTMSWWTIIIGFVGFFAAMLTLGLILYFAEALERIFGKKIIRIFSKVSGVILIGMAAQMIARGFFAYLDTSLVGQKIIEALTK